MARYVVTVYGKPVHACVLRRRASRKAENYYPRTAVKVLRATRGRFKEVTP